MTRRRRWPFVVIGFLILLAGTWFATAGPRADAAVTRRAAAESALNGNDTRSAYRLARTAVALDRAPANLETFGAAAARHGQPKAAAAAFESASQRGSRTGTVGWLISAAAGDDRAALDRAVTAFGAPRSPLERAVLAHVLVGAGRFESVRQTFDGSVSQSAEETVARAIAEAESDPAAGLRLLQATPTEQVDGDRSAPVIRRLVTDVIGRLPDDAAVKLGTTLTAMQRPVSPATRRLQLADRLREFDRPRAAVALAEAAVREEPDYRDTWNSLAAAQLSLGLTEPAGRSLDISTDLDRAFGYTWHLKSLLADRTGDTDGARRFREQAGRLGYQSPKH